MKKYLSVFIVMAILMVAGIFLLTGDTAEGLTLLPVAGAALIKTSQSLKENRSLKLTEYEDWLKVIEDEKRDFTDDEKEKRTLYLNEIDAFAKDIGEAEKHERVMALAAGVQAKRDISDNEKKSLGKYSFIKATRSLLPNGKLEGVELEMHQEAIKESRENGLAITGIGVPELMMQEKRTVSATGGSSGSEGGVMVPEEIAPLVETLTAKMVLAGLGVDFWTGLKGNIPIPKLGSVSTAWEGETDANADGSPTFTKETLSPNRLGAFIPITKQFLLQTSPGVEKSMQNLIIRAIAAAVELAAINGAGSANVPEGIINTSGIGSVAGGTDGLAPTLTHIVNLEREVAVDDADVGSMGYLTNPKVRGKLKITAIDSGSGIMVWPVVENLLNGYKAAVTTAVPSNLTKGSSSGVCSAILFGNFLDMIIAQWGGMDIIVDPYTQAKAGQIEIVINSWWDVGIKRAVSFAAMLDALTA